MVISDKKASFLAIGALFSLGMTILVFGYVGVAVWFVGPGCGGPLPTYSKIITTVVALIPILMALLIVKLVPLAADGARVREFKTNDDS